MPHLIINGKSYAVAAGDFFSDDKEVLKNQIGSNGLVPDSYSGDLNKPFKDEVGFRIADEYYIARLPVSTSFETFKGPTAITLIDDRDDPETPITYSGEIIWINDEKEKGYKNWNLDVKYGYYDARTNWREQNPDSLELEHLGKWIERWAKGEFKWDGVTPDAYRKLVAAIGNHAVSKAYYVLVEAAWGDPGQVKITCRIIPPPSDIKVQVIAQKGTQLTEAQKQEVQSRIRDYFKTPLTYKRLQKAHKKIEKDFRDDPRFFITGMPEMPAYNDDRTLSFPVVVRPVYHSFKMMIHKFDAEGKPLETREVNPAKLGIEIHYPLNLKNAAKTRNEIAEYYADLGYFIDMLPVNHSTNTSDIYTLPMNIHPAPNHLNFKCNLGPRPSQVENWFTEPGKNGFTNKSIEEGRLKLLGWYETNGYKINSDEFTIRDESNNRFEPLINPLGPDRELTIKIRARKREGFEVHAGGSQAKTWLDEHGVETVTREFPGETGDYINKYDLEAAKARIEEQFPLIVEFRCVLNEKTGDETIHVVLFHKDFSDIKNGFVRNFMENWKGATFGLAGESTGIGANAGTGFATNDGYQISVDGSVSGFPNYTDYGAGADYTVPWLNKNGTSMNVHGNLDWIPSYEKYNSQQLGITFKKPLGGPFSKWALIYGLDMERLDSAMINPEFWTKPNAGIQYYDNGFLVKIVAGPRVSSTGQVYSELSITVSKTHNLGPRGNVFFKSESSAGIRYGDLPSDFTDAASLPLGPAMVYAKTKVGLLFKLLPKKRPGLAIGPGAGITTFGITGTPQAIIGVMMEDQFIGNVLFGGAWNLVGTGVPVGVI